MVRTQGVTSQHNEEGKFELAEHLHEILEVKLNEQTDFNLAVAIEESNNSKAHILEDLGIKENEISRKVLSKKNEAPRKMENTISISEARKFSTQDNIDKKYEPIENSYILKINNYINAAEKNIEDGNFNIAKHIEQIVQDKLDEAEDLTLAIAIEKSNNSSTKK